MEIRGIVKDNSLSKKSCNLYEKVKSEIQIQAVEGAFDEQFLQNYLDITGHHGAVCLSDDMLEEIKQDFKLKAENEKFVKSACFRLAYEEDICIGLEYIAEVAFSLESYVEKYSK